MPQQNQQKNTNDQPLAFEFVLVKDESGEFKYYHHGRFYSYAEVSNLLSPKELEKLNQQRPIQPTIEKEPVPAEMPVDKRQLEQQMIEAVARRAYSAITEKIGKQDENKMMNIIISFLRLVRKEVEIKYILTASMRSGGIGLDDQRAETVIQIIKSFLPEISRKRLKILRGEPLEIESRQTPPIAKSAEPAPLIGRKKLSGLDETKPVISDITLGPGLTGPVEELGGMDLINIRRLGSNREEIVSEIMERINLLAEQSLEQKIRGIKAWQQSPVYRMYVDLGFESISNNIPVEKLIEQKIAEGKKVLNREEFQAMVEINGRMQF
ncbi:MAG: hypothetical protein ACOZBH_03430 [Patescibacteria group bacterium]